MSVTTSADIRPTHRDIGLSIDRNSKLSFTRQLKQQIISKIYFGIIRGSSKLPSVRELSGRLKVNPKTIRKTYHELQNDGYLIIKPRVGVVVKAPVINSDRLDTHVKRIKFVRQNILEASTLGLSPEQLVTLIQKLDNPPDRKQLSVVVIECNREQNQWFANQIRSTLNITAHEVLLEELANPTDEVKDRLIKAQCFATTHFHWNTVCEYTQRNNKPVLQLRLAPQAFKTIVDIAKVEPVGFFASDIKFLQGMQRALMTVAPKLKEEHILTADINDPKQVRSVSTQINTAFVSPLCVDRVSSLNAEVQVHTLAFKRMIALESMDTLQAALLME